MRGPGAEGRLDGGRARAQTRRPRAALPPARSASHTHLQLNSVQHMLGTGGETAGGLAAAGRRVSVRGGVRKGGGGTHRAAAFPADRRFWRAAQYSQFLEAAEEGPVRSMRSTSARLVSIPQRGLRRSEAVQRVITVCRTRLELAEQEAAGSTGRR
jgi:hypothetical protein